MNTHAPTALEPMQLIHDLRWPDLPETVQHQTKRCLLDLIGVAAGGTGTRLSRIVRDHAQETFGGDCPILFDGRTASPAGVALAAGMTIDALDGHDGYNPAKGHIGCPLFPAALSLAHHTGASGAEFLTAIAVGYEFGARAALTQHATVPDYHSSGSWGAVTAAAAGARLTALSTEQTRHALGIAEYHGPRSQMMRCIDHPSMLKDGSGWGAMTGVSATLLAAKGFTGAPAITVEEAPEHWKGLGLEWRILDQYFKPYPVCRWAQAPVEGVLALRREHGLTSEQVDRIEVYTFHEAVRLATNTPKTTEEAQYSTSFPCAIALVRGAVTPDDLDGDALFDSETLRLSQSLQMIEDQACNATFPAERHASVTLVLKDGTRLESSVHSPRWDHRAPPSDQDLAEKFLSLTDPLLGPERAEAIAAAIDDLDKQPLESLTDLLFQPIN